MATGRMVIGLACSCLITIFFLAMSLPAPPPCSSRSSCSQLKSSTELGTVSRRLLSYNGLTTRRLGETADNSRSRYYSQGEPCTPNYPYDTPSTPNYPYGSWASWGTGANVAQSSSRVDVNVVPIVASTVSVALFVLVVALVCCSICRGRTRPEPDNPAVGVPCPVQGNYGMAPPNTSNIQPVDTVPKLLTRASIEHATNNFRIKLGEGCFGKVYLGELQGRRIAVKELTRKELNVTKKRFESEMEILMKIKHRNLVKLLAYCNEGSDRFLCFEYLSGGSLDKLLYASKQKGSTKTRGKLLDWRTRYNIIKEVRTGLHYLHVESDDEEKILHMDLKAGNILLSEDATVVKIADFGISRLLDTDKTYAYISEGTIIGMGAYLPKECFVENPKVSEKSDIYSYGMFLLEMVTGWCATNDDFLGVQTFQEKALGALRSGNVSELLDGALRENCNVEEVLTCIRIASNCLNFDPNQRPDTKQIEQMLGG